MSYVRELSTLSKDPGRKLYKAQLLGQFSANKEGKYNRDSGRGKG